MTSWTLLVYVMYSVNKHYSYNANNSKREKKTAQAIQYINDNNSKKNVNKMACDMIKLIYRRLNVFFMLFFTTKNEQLKDDKKHCSMINSISLDCQL